jgi:hypothetical protein
VVANDRTRGRLPVRWWPMTGQEVGYLCSGEGEGVLVLQEVLPLRVVRHLRALKAVPRRAGHVPGEGERGGGLILGDPTKASLVPP